MQLSGSVTVEIPVDRLAQALARELVLILREQGDAGYEREPESGPQGTGRPWPGAQFGEHDPGGPA